MIQTPNTYNVETPILDRRSAEVVEIALQALQGAAVELVEWGALLLTRMGVPRILPDFSYLVPDDSLDSACSVLESIGLPLSPPSDLLLRTQGDLYARGRFYRITRSTLPSSICWIVLYPFSLAAFSHSELSKQQPSYISHSQCSSILVPRPSAVCAFIIRTMTKYPQYCSTRTVLNSYLADLVVFFFLGYTLHDLPKGEEEAWEREDEDRRIVAASQDVKQWYLDGEWRRGEEWIGDALAGVVTGSRIANLPSLPRS